MLRMINGKNTLTIGLVSTRKGEKNMNEYKVKYQDANGNIYLKNIKAGDKYQVEYLFYLTYPYTFDIINIEELADDG